MVESAVIICVEELEDMISLKRKCLRACPYDALRRLATDAPDNVSDIDLRGVSGDPLAVEKDAAGGTTRRQRRRPHYPPGTL